MLLLFTLLLCACGKQESIPAKVQYVPFQAEEDGRWGLISTEGEVLFADEFANEPTVAMNDRFMVRNKDGEWEIYTAEEKPKQVGDSYVSIGVFVENVTPAVKKGEAVMLINTDGEVVKDMSKVDGKTVEGMSNFSDGIAVFKTSEGLCGAVDTDGEVVIAPQYLMLLIANEGKAIGIDKKYRTAFDEDDFDKLKYAVINTKNGEVTAEISGKGLRIDGDGFEDGAIAGRQESDGSYKSGLLSEDGEWLLKPQSKFERICGQRNKHFVFSDGDNIGLADYEGNVTIRAKYDGMFLASDKVAFVYDDKDDEDRNWVMLNYEGERIGTKRFGRCMAFLGKGKYAPVQLDDDEWGFVDEQGELLELDKGVDICDMGFNTADDYIESDYVDFNEVVNALAITRDGLGGFSVGADGETAVKAMARMKGETGDVDPETLTGTSSIDTTKNVGALNATIEVAFSDYVGQTDTRTVYENYYGYSFPREEITGYSFRPGVTVTTVGATFSSYGKLDGKESQLYAALAKKVKTLGTTVKEGKSGVVVSIGVNKYAIVRNHSYAVSIVIGQGDADILANDLIDDDDVEEGMEGEPTYDEYADTLAYDTDYAVAEDSAVAY